MQPITRRAFFKKILLGAAGLLSLSGVASISSIAKAVDDKPYKTYLPSIANIAQAGDLNPNPPSQTVKLVFIHHSTGENWLNDSSGGLGLALRSNKYYVSDTNYGWGPVETSLGGAIGSYTDIGHWYNWFLGSQRSQILSSLYTNNAQSCSYSRLGSNPGGENQIILFKSCFPNSAINGSPADPPSTGSNLLQGKDAYNAAMTVGNIKRLYNDLLGYFSAHPEKLFVVITAPPLITSATNSTQAANARAVNSWLVDSWLAGYAQANVTVFDFYNVLTSNGGSANQNDLNAVSGNHHRLVNGTIDHPTNQGLNTAAYSSGDSHPSQAGNHKATGEFLPMLNSFYHRWSGN